jgi:hypothetical protein
LRDREAEEFGEQSGIEREKGPKSETSFLCGEDNEVFVPKKDIIFRVQIWLASISVQVSSEKTNQKDISP